MRKKRNVSSLKKSLWFWLVYSFTLTACMMDAKITQLNSAQSALQLTLKVQDNNASRVKIEEGTLILALASLNQSVSQDMNLNVSITSAKGIARVNERFSSYAKAVVIPAGSTSAFISIQTNNDLLYQGEDEEFTLSISATDGEGLEQKSSSIVLVIQDNEVLPTVSFLNGSQNKNENAGTGQISVELSAVAVNTVSVKVIAVDQTAVRGTDFNYTSQLVTFNPGEISKTVTFSLLNRIGIQPSRNFKLQFIDPINTLITNNTSGSLTKEHIVTILDVDRPSLSINDVIVNEGNVASFTVSSSASFSSDITVDYSLVLISAVANTDVTVSSGTITIPASSATASLNITTLTNPAICDGSKSFKVVLSNPVNATIGDNEGLGTINDITNPSISLSTASVSANEGVNAALSADLSTACPTRTVSVQYSTAAGTAASTSDFSSASNALLTFTPGQTSQSISIPTASDTLDEVDENFTVSLSSPTNGTLGSPSSATVTILDDDAPPSVTLSSSSASISEGGTSVTLTATLSAVSGKNISIPFTLSGTATDASDFTITASPITLNAGSLSANIVLSPIEDAITDPNENVTVTLSSPTNATLGATFAQTVTIVDNDLGAFSISGVIGASDSTVDSNLSNGVVPGLNWTASASATGYKVSILSDDLVNVICSEQTVGNVLTYQFLMADCSLAASTYYRLRVRSTDGLVFQNASNNDYRFYVNTSPSLASNGEGPWYVLAGSSITINALGGASPTVGVVTDTEGDTVTFSSTGSGSLGTVTAGTNSFSYSVASDATLHGTDSISYTITDSRGGTRSGSIVIHVMQPYSWTGQQSLVWSTPGNWCGSISADKRSCAGASSAPGAASSTLDLYFDNTCVSGRCSPTTTSNISVKGVHIKANGFNQGSGFTLTAGTNGWTQSGGAFVGSSGATAANDMTTSKLIVSGGSFSAPKATLIVGGNITIAASAIFDANSGKVYINGPSVVSMNGSQFYNLTTYSSNLNFNNETIRINNNLEINGEYNFYFTAGTLEVLGNISSFSGGGYGVEGTAVVKLLGNALGSTISGNSGSSIPSLTIEAGTNPVTLSGVIRISGQFGSGAVLNYVSSGAFTATGSTLICQGCTWTPGSVSYNDVQINSSANFGGNTLNVDGSLTLVTGVGYINNGTILVKRNITCSNLSLYTAGAGSALIKLISDGSPHTITGSSSCTIPQLEIATNTDNVTLAGNINIFGDYTNLIYKVTSVGTLTTTGSSLTFINAPTVFVPGNHMYNHVTFNHTGNKSLQGATMNVGGNLTLLGYNAFNNGNLNVYGDVIVNSIDPGFSLSGNIVVTLKGNDSGQTITSASQWSAIPNLIIDTNTNAVTFGTNIAVNGNLQVLTVGTLTTTGSTLYVKLPWGNVNLDLKGFPLENLNIDHSIGGYGATLSSNLVLNGTLTVNNAFINMNAQNLSANSVSLSSSSITKNGGVLTVGGSVVGGTGSMYGGTVNP